MKKSSKYMYAEDDMLMLSGIQHFKFCPRQWALIHLEQQWEDNRLTTEGSLMHRNVDDPFYRQKCGDNICLRSVHIASKELGLYGIADVIELHPTSNETNSIQHPKYPGLWTPYPIEYKHGKPKRDETDEVQLTAQVMCLEEMYQIQLHKAYFFYGAIKHRQEIEITEHLRTIVREIAEKMHHIFNKELLPAINLQHHCQNCSLKNNCMPSSTKATKVATYLNKYLYEKTP